MKLCKDCGLPLLGRLCETSQGLSDGLEVGDHPGICCDCFDEKMGMPVEKRIRPRPSEY